MAGKEPKVVHYRNDGSGRDAYVNMRVPAPTHILDLARRRDTLPDNVYRYLQEQVHREQYDKYVRDLAHIGSRNSLAAGGRRVIPRDRVEMQDEGRMKAVEEKYLRQQRLKALYEQDMDEWQEELAAKGYAIERRRE
eukprot:TRINITY_DN43142_c0_g1_i1.p1 TRINITY_DN43142_c0_g1~~TRINITY_DN43142_c0_g1_i1.p1  ORF type:complete len:137 (+),score=62.26 TRINITY_DN43142_c0_g1_i1:73-483(+)